MSQDYLLQNAPLVEVIAEVHWKLQVLKSAPNAAIDPQFSLFEPEFRKVTAGEGFHHVDRLLPPDFPAELLPDSHTIGIALIRVSGPYIK